MKPDPVAVLVCRVGEPCSLEFLWPSSRGSHVDFARAVVGGFVERIPLEPGIELWCNEDARARKLPLNRELPGVGPQVPPVDFIIDLTKGQGARPGEPGTYRILGDFLVVRFEGGTPRNLTGEDVKKYGALLDSAQVSA